MKPNPRTPIALLLIFLLAAGCAPSEQEMVDYAAEETRSAEETLAALPEESTTPTTDWFPATPTHTVIPTLAMTATPEMLTDIGNVILEDTFTDEAQWALFRRPSGTAALGNDELTLAISAPRTYISSQRQGTVLSAYFLEITASPNLCREGDSYGVLVRIQSETDYARLVLNCSGFLRFERVHNNEVVVLQDWTASGQVRPGAPIEYRLGIWSAGEELRIFVNGAFQFSTQENTLLNGGVGVFARSAGETAVSVSFSELSVRALDLP
jgi:hypothetical protein